MTGPLGSFPRTLASTTRPCRVPGHPEAIPEHLRNIPRRIDDPATAARVALDLLRSRHEDLTLALYLDDRHRPSLPMPSSPLAGCRQLACRSTRSSSGRRPAGATGCVLVGYRRYGARSASKAEDRFSRTIAAACSRYGFTVVDHLVVVSTGSFTSALGS